MIVGLTIARCSRASPRWATPANAQRRSVQTDVVMRNYAEATKAANTETCVVGGTYTVVYPAPLPTGFTISGAGNACPTQVTVSQLLTLDRHRAVWATNDDADQGEHSMIRRRPRREHEDRGAALLLAVGFVVMIGAIAGGLAGLGPRVSTTARPSSRYATGNTQQMERSRTQFRRSGC